MWTALVVPAIGTMPTSRANRKIIWLIGQASGDAGHFGMSQRNAVGGEQREALVDQSVHRAELPESPTCKEFRK